MQRIFRLDSMYRPGLRPPSLLSNVPGVLFFLRWGGSDPSVDACFMLAYYAFPRWYEFGERRWNIILTGENGRTRRITCPSATLSTTNPTWMDPGANPGLRDERPATNDLSRGTAPGVLTCYVVMDGLPPTHIFPTLHIICVYNLIGN
jgi:hypothetical protein